MLPEQTVTLVGPKGVVQNVRVLGPLRKQSQVEVSLTDARALGIKPPIVLSGHLESAVEITLCTENGKLQNLFASLQNDIFICHLMMQNG